MVDLSVIFNCANKHSVKKEGVGRQHTTSTSCQNAAFSNELFSLAGKFCFGGKRFD